MYLSNQCIFAYTKDAQPHVMLRLYIQVTLANSDGTDIFHQGLHCLLTKTISRKKNTTFFGNYNL